MATIRGATLILAVGIIFANFFGVSKSILIANYFGIGPGLDAYYIAIIPPMVLTWLVLGAMQSSLIPVFIEFKTKGEEIKGYEVFQSFFTLAVIAFFILTVLMNSFSNVIISIIAPGFQDERLALASHLLKIVSPIILFGGISDLISGLFNANKKFTMPAFGAGINIMTSLAYLILFRSQGIYALAIGLLIGSLTQCVYMISGAIKADMTLGINFNFKNAGVKKILYLMAPMLLGLSFSHSNIIVDQIMASLLPIGSIAALNYANSINDIISQLFILSIGSAIFPFFSQLVAEKRTEDLKETFYTAVRMAAFVLIPLTVLVMILGKPAVHIVLEKGQFDNNSTTAVSGAWKAFSLGLFAFATNVITARALASYGRTKFLATVAFVSIFINVILNFILMRYLNHVGIALSTSLTSFLSTFQLIFLFHKVVGDLNIKKMLFSIMRITLYSLGTGLAVYLASRLIDVTQIYGIIVAGFSGLLVYLLFAWLGQLQELKIILGQRLSRYMRI